MIFGKDNWPEPATRKSKSGQWNCPNWNTLIWKLGEVGCPTGPHISTPFSPAAQRGSF
jgi:hypothetical protein